MTYIGALILIISALFVGVSRAKEEKHKVKTLRELCSALDIFKNEICANKTPIGKVAAMESLKAFSNLRPFFTELEYQFESLGEKRFTDIWSESVLKTLKQIPEKSKNELIALGNSLGRYDSDLQRAVIERCIQVLKSECEELERGLSDNEKMYIGLYGGAGLILALALI